MPPPYADDRSLVDRLIGGDEEAFSHFFDAFFPKLYRFALARLDNDPAHAEDVVQATLTRAVTKLATYRGEAALYTWLCTFCRLELCSRNARQRRTGTETPRV